MSPIGVPAAIEAYAEAHTTPEAAHLRALAEETRAAMSSPEMLSGPVAGRLLEILTWLARPRLVLELGTYSGYSALTMAAVLPPGGRIVTCELSEERAAFAQRHIDASSYADRIEIRRGPALDTIASLDGPFDLVFIDADKSGYPDYYEAVVPKLAPAGLVVIDNTLQDGEVVDPHSEQARVIAGFNDRVMADPRTVNVLLTVRDGITLARRA
ncbi:MAG TPA: O-methyltransferase [Solirubrobacteraceae bacterium]|nr:O-methyltransferase [Solirubrobacteraceae bacterium]